MALRNKYELIDSCNPEVLVIQECEDPSRSTSAYREWAGDYLWVGQSKNKGLAIFSKHGHSLQRLSWETHDLMHFLPCRISDEFNLIGVWTKTEKGVTYLDQLWNFLERHAESLAGMPTILIGDFNSNSIWDKRYGLKNHSALFERFRELGFTSLHHELTGESLGDEKTPTLFMNRNLERSYHVDYALVSTSLRQSIKAFEIGQPKQWVEHSDHMPLFVEVETLALVKR